MARTEFDHDQYDEAYPPGIERSWWSRARNTMIGRAFRRHVPSNARVLEVGCGTGIVTAHLRSLGWEVTGVELGRPTRGLHAAEHLLLGTDVFDLPLDQRTGYGVLALFDVLEHLEDPAGFLRRLLLHYPNAHTVIITVPARQELWTSFDEHYGHHRRYDLAMVRTLFATAGLTPVSVRYFFHTLYPAIAVNNLLRGRKRNIRFAAPAPGLSSTLNAAVAACFAAEAALLPGALPGSSIIAVARRAPSAP